MSVGEAPSNWLSKIIEVKRREINRLIEYRERKAESKAIVTAIKGHRLGAELAAKEDLADVVWDSLIIANRVEQEIREKPKLNTASPAIQASWHIFDELKVARPDAEF